jgi:hypothetical protein
MSKTVRRGFDPGEVSTFYADFFSILAEYDKKGSNPLGSRAYIVRPISLGCLESDVVL